MKRDEAENHSYVIRKIPPKNKSTAAIQEFSTFQGIFCSDEGKTEKKRQERKKKNVTLSKKNSTFKRLPILLFFSVKMLLFCSPYFSLITLKQLYSVVDPHFDPGGQQIPLGLSQEGRPVCTKAAKLRNCPLE